MKFSRKRIIYHSTIKSLKRHIFTGRNEVVAKVIFLHLSVIHSVHRGGLPQCMLRYHQPPWDTTTPWDQTPPEQTPPWDQTPQSRPPAPDTPQSRHPPGPDSNRADPPPPRTRPPPGPDTLPPRKQTPAYGLRAAGTHPTGMHSCCFSRMCTACSSSRRGESPPGTPPQDQNPL